MSQSSATALIMAPLSPRTVLAAQLMVVSYAGSGVQAVAAACTVSAAPLMLTVARAVNPDRVSNLRRF